MTKKTYVFQVTETRTIECEYGVEADDLAEARDLAKIGYTTWEYANKHTMKVINHEVGPLKCVEVDHGRGRMVCGAPSVKNRGFTV